MRRAVRLVLLAGIVLAFALRIGAPATEAHGIPDQTLAGDPGCIAAALKGEALTTVGPLRQEIVPAAADIVGIDVCLTLDTAANVRVTLYQGTIATLGAQLNTGTTPNPMETDWVHIEFPVTTPVTPGGQYVIEVSVNGGAPFKWRGTCGNAAPSPCTGQDPDLYAAGLSSQQGLVRDFAFRTFAEQDNDLDGVNDGIDNCVGVYNPLQEHSDSNVTPLASYGKAFDDKTWPNHDDSGDACDGDDDNDGLLDSIELSGPCGAPTDPTKRDTDGDTYIDFAECALGTDPNSAASVPANPAPGTDNDGDGLSNDFEINVTGTLPGNANSDGDKVTDGREFKFFGSSPLLVNTDSDACHDGKEVASVNGDQSVTAIDLSQVAQHFGNSAQPQYIPWFDITRDGSIGAIDLSQVAQQFGPCI